MASNGRPDNRPKPPAKSAYMRRREIEVDVNNMARGALRGAPATQASQEGRAVIAQAKRLEAQLREDKAAIGREMAKNRRRGN